jgi:hypothetical protein
MAGTERLNGPMDPPRPAGGRSGGVGAGDSPVRWDDDDDDCGGGRVEGLAVSSPRRLSACFVPVKSGCVYASFS